MQLQGAGASGGRPQKRGGLAYRVGFGVILLGLLVISLSWFLGGLTGAAVTTLLALLGAPEEREFLPPNQPSLGANLLQFYGVALLVSGVCILGLRLLGGLLGLAGKSEAAARLAWDYKLGFAATALGFSIVAVSWFCRALLYELFLYQYDAGGLMSALVTAAWGGGAILLAGAVFLAPRLLARRRRRPPGRTLRLGWGALGHGWLTRLGFGLVGLGLAGTLLGLGDLPALILLAGIGILVAGVLLQLFAGGRRP